MIHFHNPFYLFGLILIVPIYFLFKKWRKPSLLYSDTSWIGVKPATKLYTNIGEYLLLGILAFIFVALARPQRGYEYQVVQKEGIDIVLILDISGSMRAEDFKPENRLEVAKNLAVNFIQKRKGDRIGLVIFAREGLIQSPLTLDHRIVEELIGRIDFGVLSDGTAIGMGISYGTLLLSGSKTENKVMILLTDGRNNAGKIDPETASSMANEAGIKIYTIGVGKRGEVPFPVRTAFGLKRYVMANFDLDDDQLRRIAEGSGGEYFRATSPSALEEIYDIIDRMEPTTFELERVVKYREKVHYALVPALFLFIVFFIEPIISRRIP